MKVFSRLTGIALATAAFATAGVFGSPISSAKTVPCTKGAQASLEELRETTPETDEVLKYYQSEQRRGVFDKLVGCIGTALRDQLDPATITFAEEDVDADGNGWAYVYADIPNNKYVAQVTLMGRVKNGIVALAETPRMFTLSKGNLDITVHANAALSESGTHFYADAPVSYSWSATESRFDGDGEDAIGWVEDILAIGVNNSADDGGRVTFDYKPLDRKDQSLHVEVRRAALDRQIVATTTDAINLDRSMVERLRSMDY